MAKSVLITGGAKRLGKEMALSLAQKGWDVALHFRNSESDAETTRQRIEKTGVVCRLFQANLERAQEAVDMLRKVLKEFPELELLVNNASVFDESPLATVDEEVFDRQFDVNFKSPFFMTQQYTKNCRSGHVVNILDTKIQSNRAGRFTAYNLSKKALMHLTQMSAIDLAPRFRVNAIAPGPVLKASHASEEEFQIRIQQTPLQLEIPGSSIVSALNYLIENPNLTGEVLYCDNGSHLN
ncbi:MAG: SDR family NAD(P)-dependent oxidoreductase [SAR324 cluster bacterium]|nr:SDR family NAD(P)-dependent oxidoreductase [SAR324 cluster bacterium]